MKKIIFSTMIASLLAFVGCQNEELVSDNSTDHGNGKKVTLTAHIQGSADSRVALTPATDENSKPIVMVDWRNSDKKEFFKVACFSSEGFSEPTTFTQEEGSQFTGTIPSIPSDITPWGFWATYGGTMDESGWDYDLSQQDGTLNEEFVLMEAKMVGATLPNTIDFEHKTAILQLTFTGVEGEIEQIVMSGVKNEISPTNNATGQITITPTDAQKVIYVFLTMPDDNNETYISNHTFNFTVTDKSNKYTGSLTIPNRMSIEAGKLYTAVIELSSICNLPTGTTFNNEIKEFLSEKSLTKIKFIANSKTTSDDEIDGSGAYMVANAGILEIHTAFKEFKFNAYSNWMFAGLDKINAIDFGNSINTSNVTDMTGMFDSCIALTSLNLSKFNTSNVTYMTEMFHSCIALTSLYLSNFDTSNVTYMTGMFSSCSALTSLNLSNFKTSKVTSMAGMFSSCSALAELDIRNFTIIGSCSVANIFFNMGTKKNKTQVKVTEGLESALSDKGIEPTSPLINATWVYKVV